MKKLLFLLVFPIFLISCVQEEIDVPIQKIEKSEEMLLFEKDLQAWYSSKRNSSEQIIVDNNKIKKSSINFLSTLEIDIKEFNSKKNLNTDALVLYTMNKYSETLNKMNNTKN